MNIGNAVRSLLSLRHLLPISELVRMLIGNIVVVLTLRGKSKSRTKVEGDMLRVPKDCILI